MFSNEFINKTEHLEKGIERFPSLYVSGGASIGKTTAVKLLLEAHPEVEAVWVSAQDADWMQRLEGRKEQWKAEALKAQEELDLAPSIRWYVVDDLPGELGDEETSLLITLVKHLAPEERVILIGRERLPQSLLELYWKRLLEQLPAQSLLFDTDDIQDLLDLNHSALSARRIYGLTGGWAGCVDLLVRMPAARRVERMMESYEIKTYLRREIMGSLSDTELNLLRVAVGLPWLRAQLLVEVFDWSEELAEDTLSRLLAKGLLRHNDARDEWSVVEMFHRVVEPDMWNMEQLNDSQMSPALWYERQYRLREAFELYRLQADTVGLTGFMERHYKAWVTHRLPRSLAIEGTLDRPWAIYLRGIKARYDGALQRLDVEMNRAWQLSMEDEAYCEVALNLTFINQNVSFASFMAHLEMLKDRGVKGLSLYTICGYSPSALCGLRDLSGLFACAKKDENHYKQIWQSVLGEPEQTAYTLARIEFLAELQQTKAITNQDQEVLLGISKTPEGTLREELLLVGYYLLTRGKAESAKEIGEMELRRVRWQLENSSHVHTQEIADCVTRLLSSQLGQPDVLTHWLRATMHEAIPDCTEANRMELYARARGFLMFGQHDRAMKVLEKMEPFYRKNHYQRFGAEILFMMAVISWERGDRNQALRQAVESFLVCGQNRYVEFYTSYHKSGRAVIEYYAKWQESNNPAAWTMKKRYNYGNVLHMPEADYIEVLLRKSKRRDAGDSITGNAPLADEEQIENLTMMETMMLHHLDQGLSNAEICDELGLKLTTVKTHIYNLYKKLGVKNRVQAIGKGKELGLLQK